MTLTKIRTDIDGSRLTTVRPAALHLQKPATKASLRLWVVPRPLSLMICPQCCSSALVQLNDEGTKSEGGLKGGLQVMKKEKPQINQ